MIRSTRSTNATACDLAAGIKTLNREIRALQAEYAEAPNFSFSKRVKVTIAEEIVRLEGRKADYVRKLNTLNQNRRTPRPAYQRASQRAAHDSSPGVARRAKLQGTINALYKEIGSVGEKISQVGFTDERRALVAQHQGLIRTRRDLIRHINAL